MKKSILIIVAVLLVAGKVPAQSNPVKNYTTPVIHDSLLLDHYFRYPTKIYSMPFFNNIFFERDSCQLSGDYKTSLVRNFDTLKIKNSIGAVYQVAVNYAKLNMDDSAFFYLNRYIENSSDDRPIIIDKAFDNLRKQEERWNEMITKIETCYLQGLAESVNKELALKLFYLNIASEKYSIYNKLLDLPNHYYDTVIFYDSEIRMLKADKTLMTEIGYNINQYTTDFKMILQQYGFPTTEKAGKYGEDVAYKIMSQMSIGKTYYRTVETAYQQGNFDPLAYALITDIHLKNKGKKQLYGSQWYYTLNKKTKKYTRTLYPVKDFSQVNELRKGMGFTETVEQAAQKDRYGIPDKYY